MSSKRFKEDELNSEDLLKSNSSVSLNSKNTNNLVIKKKEPNEGGSGGGGFLQVGQSRKGPR